MPYVWMNAAYRVHRHKPVIFLFSRDKNRERTVVIVQNFRPYFFVPDDQSDIIDIFGRPVRKVYTELPSDVPKERQKYSFSDEADIQFFLRYLIDVNVRSAFEVQGGKEQISKTGIRCILVDHNVDTIVPVDDFEVPPKVLYFDIEVTSPTGIFPRPSDPRFPIASIQCSSNYHDRIDVFLLVDNPNLQKYVESNLVFEKYGHEVHLHPFDDDRLLLLSFVKFVQQEDPDVLTAYNGSLFDMPYLLRRAERLRISLQGMSPLGTVNVQTHRGFSDVYIKGRDFIDYFAAYRKWGTGRQGVQSDQPFGVTFDFKRVCAAEAGFYYEDLGDRVEEAMRTTPEEWVEYCINDAYALKLLDEKTGIIQHFDRLRRIVGVPISWSLSNKKLIDTEILRESDRPLPTMVPQEDAEVQGAIVKLPPPGVHENVACFDLKSIYPSVIISFNLSAETKDPKGEIFVTDYWRFKREPEGIIPKVTRKYMEERERLRALRKKLTGKEHDRVRQLETLYKFLACVSGDTLIDTPMGFVPISELKPGDVVYGWKNGKIVETRVIAVMRRQASSYYVLTPGKGKSLRITGEHPVLTASYRSRDEMVFRTVSELKERRKQYSPHLLYRRTKLPTGSKAVPLVYAWLLGFWIAEGSVTNCGDILLSVADSDEVARSMVRRAGHDLKWTCKTNKYLARISGRGGFKTFLRKIYDYKIPRGKEKYIPSEVLTWNEDCLSAFLAGYIRGDGHIERDHRSELYYCRIFTAVRQIARSLRLILLKLGHPAWIYQRRSGPSNVTKKESWIYVVHFTFTRRDNVLERVGIRKKELIMQPLEVWNIETDCGTYIANDIVVHNCSIYGVNAYRYFRMFDPEVANAITYLGRLALTRCEKMLARNGYQVIYEDTDSLFVKMKTKLRREVNVVEYLLNEELRQFARIYGAKYPPVIKFERLFKRILFKTREKGKSAKKRYAGVDEKGNLYIIGFEPRRSSTAEITRTTMKKFFEKVLVEEDIDGAIQLVREVWQNLPKYPIQKVAVPKGLQKTVYKVKNPWIVGKEYAEKYFGKVFREDKKPRLVYVKQVIGKPPTHAICLTEDDTELPPGVIVDWKRMREVTIKKPFEGLLASIGYDFSVIEKGIQQQSLGRYLGGNLPK